MAYGLQDSVLPYGLKEKANTIGSLLGYQQYRLSLYHAGTAATKNGRAWVFSPGTLVPLTDRPLYFNIQVRRT